MDHFINLHCTLKYISIRFYWKQISILVKSSKKMIYFHQLLSIEYLQLSLFFNFTESYVTCWVFYHCVIAIKGIIKSSKEQKNHLKKINILFGKTASSEKNKISDILKYTLKEKIGKVSTTHSLTHLKYSPCLLLFPLQCPQVLTLITSKSLEQVLKLKKYITSTRLPGNSR